MRTTSCTEHRLFALLAACLLVVCAQAQQAHAFGLLPSVNVVRELPKDWSLNGRVEARERLLEEGWAPRHVLTDLGLLGARKLGIGTTVTAGYQLRLARGEQAHRTLQQLAVVRRLARFRLAHRVATDQTWTGREPVVLRVRYRISAEVPLTGTTVDPNEGYLKLNNEYLAVAQDEERGGEVRLAVFLGRVLRPGRKLELGLEHRAFTSSVTTPVHRTWLGVNYYVSF
ncbi:MAG: DUF2490 domain-containing protein [Flavobacteriales bacterium]|nr:DUF2490 domain-containing protein [Flavobacteriales bacterium]MCB0788554.1 DUF2490 domain-containing protein [Flavobacteriales bacterium]MCB0809526.1 DUF2490 domain-containing protein [Flavobacteriales bacterium]MCB0813571.1 DUF2490 domain-containing protein [Flavobacteriales bacterium]MCB0815931.1 DUF2490 domain-containing protein [Flavobacteriales bacterium]